MLFAVLVLVKLKFETTLIQRFVIPLSFTKVKSENLYLINICNRWFQNHMELSKQFSFFY